MTEFENARRNARHVLMPPQRSAAVAVGRRKRLFAIEHGGARQAAAVQVSAWHC